VSIASASVNILAFGRCSISLRKSNNHRLLFDRKAKREAASPSLHAYSTFLCTNLVRWDMLL
jgi:hypothetical protein